MALYKCCIIIIIIIEPCLAITHFDHMFPHLTAELVCEYMTKEMWKTGQLFVVSRVR